MPTEQQIRLAPDASRVAALDGVWRARLATSLDYLSEVLTSRGEPVEALSLVGARLTEGPTSPWASCLYARLVSEITRADRPSVAGTLDALREAAARPAREPRPASLDDDAIPGLWREQFLRLIDTDRELPFRPLAPSPRDADACRTEIAAALDLAKRADPPLHAELQELLRAIVLGAPGSADPKDDFGACSTFFMRELVLINAARRRSPIRMLDTLVHEASHVLLFGLAMEKPLTTDNGEVRLKSAARDDLRPLEGVYHAAFVMTRVHIAMSRLLASGGLGAFDAAEAAERRDRNGEVARASLESLSGHPSLTPLGAEIVATMSAYWAQARDPAAA